MSDEFMVSLDRPRQIRWTFGAQVRLGSLDRPPALADLAHPRKSYSALCAIIWASLVEKNHPFESPEDIAPFIDTSAKSSAASTMLIKAIKEGNAEASKKASGAHAPSQE